MSKYRFMSDEELLMQVETARGFSPVIDELCDRLEAIMEKEKPQLFCPVCEANLADAKEALS